MPLAVQLVSPERILFEGEAEMVDVLERELAPLVVEEMPIRGADDWAALLGL